MPERFYGENKWNSCRPWSGKSRQKRRRILEDHIVRIYGEDKMNTCGAESTGSTEKGGGILVDHRVRILR